MFSRNRLFIEMSAGNIKYIIADTRKNKAVIREYGFRTLPENCYSNGVITDELRLGSFLQQFKKENGIKSCRAHITINEGSFISRPVQIPILEEKDIEKHLSLDAEQYIPVNINNVYYDFKVLEKVKSEEAAYSKVLITAGPKDVIDSNVRLFDASKLSPTVIDVYPNNISRLFEQNQKNDIAVVDLGRKNINITILENRKFYMHSFISAGFDSILENLSFELNCNLNNLKYEQMFAGYNKASVNQKSTEINDDIEKAIVPVFNQIHRYLDYYNSRHFGKTVEKIYLIGEYSLIKGLILYVSRRFNTEAEIGIGDLSGYNIVSNEGFISCLPGYYSLLGSVLRSCS